MPAPPPVDRYQPSFLRFPIQNDRTGFRPVALPVILVVPGRRNENGTVLANSGVYDVKYFIVDAPDPSLVAGPFNTGLLVPQLDQFVVNVTTLQLADNQIEVDGQEFQDSQGNPKSFDEVTEGDQFLYTLRNGDVRSTVPYYPDADYYDLSTFEIDVEDLPRPKRYLFVWQASYNKRIIRDPVLSSTQGAFCISDVETAISQFKIKINHPGEVHHEMFRRTPSLYFDQNPNNFELANDQTLAFYRPFADLLQDIFDEQFFLNGINHIDTIPAQLIPYLAYLIGWDLPNYPGVTDEVRRSILRQAVRLQQLKGSRRAIIELFDIFGFTIEIINLWYSTDGTRLIGPEESLPEVIQGEEIDKQTRCQLEPITADFSDPGFGAIEVPLLHRPTSNITVTAFLVQEGNTKDTLDDIIIDVTDNPENYETACESSGGALIPRPLLDRVTGSDDTLISTSEVVVDITTGLGQSTASSTTVPIINDKGVTFDRERNILSVVFDHHLDFSDDTSIYLFATYAYDKILVPDILENLRSNRFDVRILLHGGSTPAPQLLEFLMNFVFKLKAFHSLLRKIVFRMEILQAYNVQDLCYGDESQLQVPPPVEPIEETVDDCNTTTTITQGYKQEDLDLRQSIFDALTEEFEAWRLLDGTRDENKALERFLNLPVAGASGDQCQYTYLGQDRVTKEPDDDLDHNEDLRTTVCSDRPPLPDNCFKGRVADRLLISQNMINCEVVRCKPCPLGVGSGFFWLYPTDAQSLIRDGFGSYEGQNSTSFLGRKISQYGKPIPHSIHYTNRPYLIDGQLDGDRLLAYRKPSLEVQKDNFAFPSHRFPTISNLEENFTHPVWKAKPWDNPDDDLNARLEVDENGDEYLVFDEVDVVYLANGLTPDISSFDEHEDRSYLVTHKVYMTAAENHPAITLDDTVVLTQDEELEFDSSVLHGPIFRSYNTQCDKDYLTGHPAETSRFEVGDDFGFDRGDSFSSDIAQLLGLPYVEATDVTGERTALFTFGSQILVGETDPQYSYYRPYRMDCDCLRYGCDVTALTGSTSGRTESTGTEELVIETCHLDFFRQPNGGYDFNCDQLAISPTIKMTEQFGSCSTRMDGSIPNMLCQQTGGVLPDNLEIAPEGSYRYKDDYDIIYESSWVFVDDVLDILLVTKSPRVWGELEEGYIDNGRVFRKGIITTTRQIIRVDDEGYTIQGQGSEQRVDYFQTNILCGDQPYVDNFCFHLDCYVTDELENLVVCGPRWVDCYDQVVEWPSISTDSYGQVQELVVPEDVQPFGWVSIWSNEEQDDITGICAEGTEPSVEVTYANGGGLVPPLGDFSAVWPTKCPNYVFSSEIFVDIDRRITEFVSINLFGFLHSFSGDLHAILYAPNGIGVTVFHRPGSVGGSFGNHGNFYGDYRFVEPRAGVTDLPHWFDITPGTYARDPGDWPGGVLPLGTFEDFNRVETYGVWRLVIYDWFGGDEGSLDGWSLTLKVTCGCEKIVCV